MTRMYWIFIDPFTHIYSPLRSTRISFSWMEGHPHLSANFEIQQLNSTNYSHWMCLDIFMFILSIHSFIHLDIHSFACTAHRAFAFWVWGTCDILLNANYQRLLTVFYYLTVSHWLTVFTVFFSVSVLFFVNMPRTRCLHFWGMLKLQPQNLRQLQT